MDETTNEIELEETFVEEEIETNEAEESKDELEGESGEEELDDRYSGEEIDLEYDEDGNVIIPEDDVPENEDTSDEKPEENTVSEENRGAETASLPDARDAEISRLQSEKEEFENLLSDALATLGIKAENGKEALIKLAAEAEEITPEEYLNKLNEKKRFKQAEAILRKTEFEKKAQLDLAEIHAAFPETKIYKSIYDIPNLQEFGSYRDKGLTAKKAYIAANPDTVRTSVAEATKKQSLNETKNHLKSNVPKGSKDTSLRMTRRELESYRDLFPGMSDKEITELYRGVTK